MGYNISIIYSLLLSILFLLLSLYATHKIHKRDWNDSDFLLLTVQVMSAIIAIILFITFWFMIFVRYDFRVNEPILYQNFNVEYSTLTSALNITSDIVDTDLYLAIVDYNKRASDMVTKYNTPAYSWSFSNKVDWNTLPYIDIKAASN